MISIVGEKHGGFAFSFLEDLPAVLVEPDFLPAPLVVFFSADARSLSDACTIIAVFFFAGAFVVGVALLGGSAANAVVEANEATETMVAKTMRARDVIINSPLHEPSYAQASRDAEARVHGPTFVMRFV
jgi:hypothetical protein